MSLVRVEPMAGVDGVTRLILDRPEQRNAVSTAMLAELREALGVLAVEPLARAVVLSGLGPDFCAGADLSELDASRSTAVGAGYGQAFDDGLDVIASHPVPVIASVQGAALGGGCQIVLACDLAVAAIDARIGIPSARLGIVIGYPNVERLVRGVGPKRAGEILYAGRLLSGEEAEAWGLVNRAVPAGQLEDATLELAAAVAAGAPLSVRGSKRGVGAAVEAASLDRFADGHRVADFEMMAAEAFASQDLGEGIRALRERRPPRFRGA